MIEQITDQHIENYFELVRTGSVDTDRHINWLAMRDYLMRTYPVIATDPIQIVAVTANAHCIIKQWESQCIVVSSVSSTNKREVYEWIRDNLVGAWTGPRLHYDYFFENEDDALLFKMMWG